MSMVNQTVRAVNSSANGLDGAITAPCCTGRAGSAIGRLSVHLTVRSCRDWAPGRRTRDRPQRPQRPRQGERRGWADLRLRPGGRTRPPWARPTSTSSQAA